MNCKALGIKTAYKAILSFLLAISLISCQTVTISPEGKPKLFSPPDYQQTQHFFLGGLIGEAVVPAGEICKGSPVAQLQSQTTFINGLWPSLVVITGMVVAYVVLFGSVAEMMKADSTPSGEDLGTLVLTGVLVSFGSVLASTIYTPKTAKVWCGEKIVVPAPPPTAADSSEAKEAS